jgi:hypothetical protein
MGFWYDDGVICTYETKALPLKAKYKQCGIVQNATNPTPYLQPKKGYRLPK